MHTRSRRLFAVIAAIGLFAAGCGDGQDAEDPAAADGATDTATGNATGGGEDTDDGGETLADPNDDVEDGVYRGSGVTLPVPDGFSLDQAAFQQGIVAAVNEDGTQQLTARAIDTSQAQGSTATPMELDALVDSVRQQIDQEAETDEEVELSGADRAHRLTYLDLPAQQEGVSDTSATIVLAEAGDDLVGEFAYNAETDTYDEAVTARLLDEAGFDPDSEPAPLPQLPQPAPRDGDDTTDDDSDDDR